MPKTTIELPALSREAHLRAETVDEAARTVEIVWTSGATVRRNRLFQDAIDEELSVAPDAVRLERLNAGAPFLNTHRAGSLEISAVPIGADPGAQVRSDDQTEALSPCILTRQENAPVKTEITKGNDMPKSKKAGGDTIKSRTEEVEVQTRTTGTKVQTPVPEADTRPDPETIRSEERQRASNIMTLCRRHNLDNLAADLIRRGATLDAARAEILDKIADADPLQGRVHEPAPATARGMAMPTPPIARPSPVPCCIVITPPRTS